MARTHPTDASRPACKTDDLPYRCWWPSISSWFTVDGLQYFSAQSGELCSRSSGMGSDGEKHLLTAVKLHIRSVIMYSTSTIKNSSSMAHCLKVKALGGKHFFANFLLFLVYLVENFLCFPTVYNIPGVIFNGFQDIWLDMRLVGGTSAILPI